MSENDEQGTDLSAAKTEAKFGPLPEMKEHTDDQQQPDAEDVADEIMEVGDMGMGLYSFFSLPGWAVKLPDAPDPKKKNGYKIESEWMAVFGITGELYGKDGLRMYLVLVRQPDGSMGVIQHSQDLKWAPAQFASEAVRPENMRPIRPGA